jgi:uncharacterized protein YktB (UPF0637 family)
MPEQVKQYVAMAEQFMRCVETAQETWDRLTPQERGYRRALWGAVGLACVP